MNRTYITTLLILISLLPVAAYADETPTSQIFEIVQEGQDVKLILELLTDRQCITEGKSCTLAREDRQGTKELFKDRVFSPDDASSYKKFCLPWDINEAYCLDHPEECNDCDKDGGPECTGKCETGNYFAVIDKCVPPGTCKYILNAEWPDGRNHELESTAAKIEDSGSNCEPTYNGETGEDSSTGDCSSVFYPKTKSSEINKILLMIFLVLFR